jgi:PEP-CTERM motif
MRSSGLKRSVINLAVVAATLAAGAAQAAVVTLDVSGINSNGVLGDATNVKKFFDLGSSTRIIGLAWDVSLRADSPSWLSEISVDLNDGAAAGLSLSPGFGSDAPGSGNYAGTADLIAMGVDFALGASGQLTMEFFDMFDDLNAADGAWQQGSLTLTYIPEPASFGLAALALLGLAVTSRRKTA